MIKTLRITTIIAAILAVGFFAFPVVFGYRGDEQVEQFLKSPGAIERFNQAKGAKVLRTGNQISPLVKQATAFGLYLNPPRKPALKPKTTVARRQAPIISEPPKVFSTKFTLIGTSYYPSRPELSLAYIDEPGKGLYWVRQGTKVAHLLIEQVKDGSIVVKDREKTVTLVAARPPKKSLIKGQTSSKSTPVVPGASASITSSTSMQVSAGESAASASGKPFVNVTSSSPRQVGAKTSPASALRKPSATVASSRARRPSPEEVAMMEKLILEFGTAMEADAEGGKTDSRRSTERSGALLDKYISGLEAMRVTTEEAKRLGRLGKELRNVQRDPNRAGSSKVQRSRIPPPPRPPR